MFYMAQNNSYPIDQWLPAVVSIVAAVLLGGCLAYDDAFLFLYPENEALNLLYAKVAAGELHFVLQDHFLDCYQSINVLVTGLLIPALWLHLPPYSALWLWQTVFNTLLLFRAAHWLQQEQPHHPFILYGLLYGNPLLWYAILLMPSQVILAWLIMEWLLCKQPFDAVSCLIVLAVSFCGSMGFIIAFLICFTSWVTPYLNRQTPSKTPAWFYVSMLPSIVFYLVQSINAQTLAGAYLVNTASPLVEWMTFSWLSFQAHENIKDYLLWIGNGGAQWWKPLPLFGIMALSGIIQQCTSQRVSIPVVLSISLLLAALLFIVPVFHTGLIQAALVLVLVLIPSVEAGMNAWLRVLSKLRMEAAFALMLLVVFLGWFRQPMVWNETRTQAALLLDINTNIQTVLNTHHNTNHNTNPMLIALPFHPTLWAALHNHNQYIPLQLAVQKEITTVESTLSGFRVHELQALPLQPDFCFQYPEQIIQEEQQEKSMQNLPFIQDILQSGYDRLQRKQISYYQLKKNLTQDGFVRYVNPVHNRMSSWFITAVQQDTPDWNRYEIKLHPVQQVPDRIIWDMEKEYSHAETTGFAFGSVPNRQISLVGSGAAVSGTGEDRRLMGALQSKPFIIQGDDLQFFANLPQDASPTLVCLAVQQKMADYNEKEPPRVEHIFDHPLHEPLVGGTHYYIKPEELHYEQDGIYGWKVVRVLHGFGAPGWQLVNWSMLPWKNHQAVWLAADLDRQSWLAIDHIIQTNRPSGIYWDFEFGTYSDWKTEGNAFGDQPSYSPIGEQLPITGYEGNYFINSFYNGSDQYTGYLKSPEFNLQHNRLRFWVGGGDNAEQVYVSLVVNGETVLRETGLQSESLRLVEWDTSGWMNQAVHIIIADQASGTWGHILADDFRLYNE